MVTNLLIALGYCLLAIVVPVSAAAPELRFAAKLIILIAAVNVAGHGFEIVWRRLLRFGERQQLRRPRMVANLVIGGAFLALAVLGAAASTSGDGRIAMRVVAVMFLGGATLVAMGGWLRSAWAHLRSAFEAAEGGD